MSRLLKINLRKNTSRLLVHLKVRPGKPPSGAEEAPGVSCEQQAPPVCPECRHHCTHTHRHRVGAEHMAAVLLGLSSETGHMQGL